MKTHRVHHVRLIHIIGVANSFPEKMRKIYSEVGIVEAKTMQEAEKLANKGVECFVDETRNTP